MSTNRITLQPAFILHSHAFRDTSLIVDSFTRDHGRISMVARGARAARSRWQGRLQPFRPLLLSWSGRSELATLNALETDGNSIPLQGLAQMSAFYLNELLQRLLHQHDPHPQLFGLYRQTLQALAQDPQALEPTLRRFESRLLDELGYGMNLEYDSEQGEPIRSDADYCYHLQHGASLMSHAVCSGIAVGGKTLLALAERQSFDAQSLTEAKRLLRAILNHYLGDKPLKTREMLKRTHNLYKAKGEAE